MIGNAEVHIMMQIAVLAVALTLAGAAQARTTKPVLHGKHWVAITGKPLGATAGAAMFLKGGNAVDAACAMLATTSTMFDVLSWGGETQALIYNPNTGQVIGINALGAAPTGATPEFFLNQDMQYPPEYGPLAAVTPGKEIIAVKFNYFIKCFYCFFIFAQFFQNLRFVLPGGNVFVIEFGDFIKCNQSFFVLVCFVVNVSFIVPGIH